MLRRDLEEEEEEEELLFVFGISWEISTTLWIGTETPSFPLWCWRRYIIVVVNVEGWAETEEEGGEEELERELETLE